LSTALPPLFQDKPEDVPHDQCGVTAVINSDRSIELFALGEDYQIYNKKQTTKGWSNWVSLGGNFTTGVQIIRNIDGRVEIFAIGQDDKLYHTWQQYPGGDYRPGWSPLGGPFSGSPSVLVTSEGNAVIFATGKLSRSLMYNQQARNTTALSWSGWYNLGGILTSSPTAVLTAESLIHIFVRGVDKGLFEKTQVPTHLGSVAWSKFDGLGGLLASHPSVPATLNPVNLLEIFVRQADRAIWYKKQLSTTTRETDGVMWSEWQSIGGKMSSGPSVIINNDGLIEVYARGMNREIFVKRQMHHDSPEYYVWETIGGDSSSNPVALIHPDHSVHVFFRAPNKKISHRVKQFFSSDQAVWVDWETLENPGESLGFQLFSC